MLRYLCSRYCLLTLGCLAVVACKEDTPAAKGELMIAVTTDMQVPKDFDSVHVEVLNFGSVQFSNDYRVGKGYLTLPGTLGVVQGATPGQPVTIRVSATQAGVARTLREIVTTVPSDRIATLFIPIQWFCLDKVTTSAAGQVSSTCPSGQTCVSGSCVTEVVDSATLPTYQAADVFGGGDGTGHGECFDTLQCFAAGQEVAVDLSSCTIDAVSAVNRDSGVSVSLVLPAGGGGICGPEACLVPIDADPITGWYSKGSQFQLPPAACRSISAGYAEGIAVTTACASKTEALPTCGDWSSVTDEPASMDAGAPTSLTGETGGTGSTISSGGATSTAGSFATGGASGFTLVKPAMQVASLGTGVNYTQGTYVLGFSFTAKRAFMINQLGYWDSNLTGTSESFKDTPVAIYDMTTGTLMGSATVSASDPATGFFRYHMIAPITVNTQDTYAVVALTSGNYYVACYTSSKGGYECANGTVSTDIDLGSGNGLGQDEVCAQSASALALPTCKSTWHDIGPNFSIGD